MGQKPFSVPPLYFAATFGYHHMIRIFYKGLIGDGNMAALYFAVKAGQMDINIYG